jgi:hypothetical protein
MAAPLWMLGVATRIYRARKTMSGKILWRDSRGEILVERRPRAKARLVEERGRAKTQSRQDAKQSRQKQEGETEEA